MDLEYILQRAKAAPLAQRHNVAKEALQQCMLAALARQGLLADVAFVGGTALRIFHRLPRFSEDMDFVWMTPSSSDQLPKWSATLRKALAKIGLTVHLQTQGPVQVDALVQKRGYTIYVVATSHAFTSFAREGLQISLEIDLDPPAHIEKEPLTLAIANNQVTVPTLTLPSLMAGKLHILLTRKDREKGRDWYDYLWYRRNGVIPNVRQLQSAIDQTSTGPEARYWMSYLRSRMLEVNWENVQGDVSRFLENKEEARQLDARTLGQLTPYPDFETIRSELHRRKRSHPLLQSDNPVLKDIEQAAMEGDESAIETRTALDVLRKKSQGETQAREPKT
ncbi:MAG: nucleotidyl transferase AbiEii/AbiGii toxin family protein [Opitutaceae bacterium]|jgi:hypothetical protein